MIKSKVTKIKGEIIHALRFDLLEKVKLTIEISKEDYIKSELNKIDFSTYFKQCEIEVKL